jgi:hypothetical protein
VIGAAFLRGDGIRAHVESGSCPHAGPARYGAAATRDHHTAHDVASWPEIGTAVLARIEAGKTRAARETSHSSFGAVSVAKSGEEVCGDAWAIDESGPTTTLFVAMGWGMGRTPLKQLSKLSDCSATFEAIRSGVDASRIHQWRLASDPWRGRFDSQTRRHFRGARERRRRTCLQE